MRADVPGTAYTEVEKTNANSISLGGILKKNWLAIGRLFSQPECYKNVLGLL